MATNIGFSLLNKHCLITGGTRGIGKAIADRFLAEGAHVTVVGRSAPSVNTPDQDRNKIMFHRGDVTEETTWQAISRQLPHPDVLVNCAGITQRKLLIGLNPEETRGIMDTNLYAAILGCRYAAKSMMRKSRGGCIINVSSLLARKGVEGTSVYAATKAGLLGLTSSLAVEYGRFNVRVNALVPGYVETTMTDDIDPGRLAKIPLGRFATVDEVADAAAFLAKNPYASNCILNLDGGLSAA